jgi:predicted outer membrane repeat protein
VLFNNNIASGSGGGIFINGGSPVMDGVQFLYNSGSSGGGIHTEGSNGFTLKNGVFRGNSSAGEGGARRI